MNKIVGIIIFVVVLVAGVSVGYKVINLNKSENIEKVTVLEYDYVDGHVDTKVVNTIEITDKAAIEEINSIYNNLRKINTEFYDMLLVKGIEIKLDENNSIYMPVEENKLCSYTGLASSEFAETPDELIVWINEALNK